MEFFVNTVWETHSGKCFKVGNEVKIVSSSREVYEGVIDYLDDDILCLTCLDDNWGTIELYDYEIDEIELIK